MVEDGMDTLYKLFGDRVECTKNMSTRRFTITCGPRSHTECQNKWYVCCHRHPLSMQSQVPSQNMQSWNFLTMFDTNSRLDEMEEWLQHWHRYEITICGALLRTLFKRLAAEESELFLLKGRLEGVKPKRTIYVCAQLKALLNTVTLTTKLLEISTTVWVGSGMLPSFCETM